MRKIQVDGGVMDLLSFYKTEKRIFGRCPHCGDVFRLSDVKLTHGKEPPRDVLTRLRKEREKLNEQITVLEMEVEVLQDDHEIELQAIDQRWRDKVGLETEKRIGKEKKKIREDAIAKSKATTLGKVIERIAPTSPPLRM